MNSSLGMELQQFEKVYIFLLDFLFEYSFQLAAAVIIFLIGLWLANKASASLLANMMRKSANCPHHFLPISVF